MKEIITFPYYAEAEIHEGLVHLSDSKSKHLVQKENTVVWLECNNFSVSITKLFAVLVHCNSLCMYHLENTKLLQRAFLEMSYNFFLRDQEISVVLKRRHLYVHDISLRLRGCNTEMQLLVTFDYYSFENEVSPISLNKLSDIV